MRTYSDHLEQRAALRRQASKHKEHKRGNIAQSDCVCSTCGTVLTSLQVNTSRRFVTHTFIRFSYTGFFHLNMCSDPQKCYKAYKKHHEGGFNYGNKR